ncbi:hypothetical protein [Gloeomargarita sp.]
MLGEFRQRYPQGCLLSELLQIYQGQYLVRVTVQAEGVTLATGLGSGPTLEAAEDRARERALLALGFTPSPVLPPTPEPQAVAAPTPPPTPPKLDVLDILAQTTAEMKRLGWSHAQGREYLRRTYGRNSRQDLSDQELLDFLQYLRSQPAGPPEPSD